MNKAMMPVRLQETWVMLDASAVREVLGPQRWLAVPRVSANIPGVCAWRGRAVPIVDLGRILGFGAVGREDYGRTLIAQHPQGLAAIPVGEAQVVQFLHEEQLRSLEGISVPYATHGVEVDGALLPHVDIISALEDLLPEESSGRSEQ